MPLACHAAHAADARDVGRPINASLTCGQQADPIRIAARPTSPGLRFSHGGKRSPLRICDVAKRSYLREHRASAVVVMSGRTARAEVALALDVAGTALAAFERRAAPIRELASHAGELVATAQAMATRFARGGKLVIFGVGGASTDAQHVAAEFVHPAITGKRALPAISLTSDAATVTAMAAKTGLTGVFDHQIRQLAERTDIALGISSDGNCPCVLAGLSTAKQIGMLTVALVGGIGGAIAASSAVDHVFTVGSADPRIVKEIHVTAYHLLWELVHLFFEHAATPGASAPGVVV